MTLDGLKGWWTEHVEGELEVASLVKFSFMDGKYWMQFKVHMIEQDERTEWDCVDADDQSSEWVGTRLLFDVFPEGQGSKLKFTHAAWKDNALVFARCNSTWGHLMFSLKDYLEKGKGQPMH